MSHIDFSKTANYWFFQNGILHPYILEVKADALNVYQKRFWLEKTFIQRVSLNEVESIKTKRTILGGKILIRLQKGKSIELSHLIYNSVFSVKCHIAFLL